MWECGLSGLVDKALGVIDACCHVRLIVPFRNNGMLKLYRCGALRGFGVGTVKVSKEC
jgi:hypothetical protein